VTSDPEAARRLILDTSGLRLIDAAESGVRPDSGVLVVRAVGAGADELVSLLVHAGIAVRELARSYRAGGRLLALTEREPTDDRDHRRSPGARGPHTGDAGVPLRLVNCYPMANSPGDPGLLGGPAVSSRW